MRTDGTKDVMKCVLLQFKMESADNGIQIIKKNVAKVTKYVLIYGCNTYLYYRIRPN